MDVKTYSYRFSEEILTNEKFKHVYDELIQICKDAPLPYYPGKSKRQEKKNIVQQIMNSYFLLRFQDFGWKAEPHASPNDSEDSLRLDFEKIFENEEEEEDSLKVRIEVEFGNVASSYRNYFKFQLSYSYDFADICVLIVPTNKLANRIDSGVSNYEKTLRELPAAKLSITVPVLVIGLCDEGVEEWNVKDIEPDLDVLKNSRSDVRDRHFKIIRDYIDSL